jgi:hypothetical protein
VKRKYIRFIIRVVHSYSQAILASSPLWRSSSGMQRLRASNIHFDDAEATMIEGD